MVKSTTGLTSAKRFGPRYGRRIKELFESAEKTQRQLHKCPYCHAFKVKRVAIGIWSCRKCNATFTGKAYVPYERPKATAVEQEVQEEVAAELEVQVSPEETTGEQ